MSLFVSPLGKQKEKHFKAAVSWDRTTSFLNAAKIGKTEPLIRCAISGTINRKNRKYFVTDRSNI